MKNKYVVGALLLVFGLLIAFGPQSIFSVCAVNPEKIMKCHWTAQAELGIGLVIAVIGALQMVMGHAKVRQGLSMAAALVGVLVVLVPLKLIGVCANAHMQCAALTRPALIVLGLLTLVIGGLSAFALNKVEK